MPVYKYALVEGACNSVKSAANRTLRQLRPQVRVEPALRHAEHQLLTSDKLSYTFGQGSRLALSYHYSGNQNVLQLGDGLQLNGTVRTPAPTC